MDTWVWDQISLEFSQVDVQSTIKAKGGSNGRNDLTNETVQVGVGWAFDIQVTTANIINGFIVDHKSAVGMFQGSMGSQNGIVRFNDGSGDLRSRVDGEFELGFLAIIN